MPNTFSRFAAYLSVLIFAISVARFEWIPWYYYFAMMNIAFLIYYNLYLFLRQVYVTKNWHVEKSLTRTLAKLSGLYVAAGLAANMVFRNNYYEFKGAEGLEAISQLQIIIFSIFSFFWGVLMFYLFTFFFKIGRRHFTWPVSLDF